MESKRREIKWREILSRNSYASKAIYDFYYDRISLKKLRATINKVPNQEFSYCYELKKRGVKKTKECIRKALSRAVPFTLILLFASICSAQQRFSYYNQPWPPRNHAGQYLSPNTVYRYYGYGQPKPMTGPQPSIFNRPGFDDYRPFWTPQWGLQYKRVR